MVCVIVKGRDDILIYQVALIVVAFGTPPMTQSEFFAKKDDLVNNFAALLGIDSSRITYVNIVKESRKRRAVESNSTMIDTIQFQISSKDDGSQELDEELQSQSRDEMSKVSGDFINSIQTNLASLESALNITVKSVAASDPLATPGTEAAKESAEVEDTLRKILIPDHTEVVAQGLAGREGSPFLDPISIVMLTTDNEKVSPLGSTAEPWRLTAQLETSNVPGAALEHAEVEFRLGYANFTKLAITHAGSGYMIRFHISFPSSPPNIPVASVGPFTVATRQLIAVVSSSPEYVEINQAWGLTVDIVDPLTGQQLQNIAWRGHSWTCVVSVKEDPSYSGTLSGQDASYSFPTNGRLTLTGLQLGAVGRVRIKVSVTSSPQEYSLMTYSQNINVEGQGYLERSRSKQKTVAVTMKFYYSHEKLVSENKTDQFMSAIKNSLAPRVPKVTVKDHKLESGSVMYTANLQGLPDQVILAVLKLAEDVSMEKIKITFEGQVVAMDRSFRVDGTEKVKPIEADDGGLSGGAIAAIVIVFLLVVLITAALAWYFLFRKPSKTIPQEESELKVSAGSHGSSSNSSSQQRLLIDEERGTRPTSSTSISPTM